jgi:Arylsulfotransferase (ASST)
MSLACEGFVVLPMVSDSVAESATGAGFFRPWTPSNPYNAPVDPKFIRTTVIIVVIFAFGFIAGQLTMSVHVKAEAEAKLLTRIEGVVRPNENLRQLEQLQTLGYVDGTVDARAELRGVEIHDRQRTCPGVNLYGSRLRASARLIDNDGAELHSWSYPGDDGWEHVELLPNGDLLVVVNQQSVFRLDKDSNQLWRYEAATHHDLAIHPSGEIYILTDASALIPEIHPDVPVMEDFIEILSPDGELEDRFSILDAMRSSKFAFLLVSPQHLPSDRSEGERLRLDILHTNHIQVFDGSLAHRSPLFAEGNILISMRTINTIAIIDPSSRSVLWAWGPSNLHRQHHPTLLSNGHILVFDNGQIRSQIVEFDPLTFEVAWRYAPRKGFLSQFRGSAQRLPNGNTLITESDRGYVFEVSPDHEIVWRFANPDVQNNNMRVAIWRMTRYPRELVFLDPVDALESSQ